MRFASSTYLAAAAVLLTVCISTTPSFADGQSVSGCSGCNGYSFQATLTPVSGSPGEYALTYTVTNNTGSPANPYNWSLTLFQSGDSISSVIPGSFSVTGSNGKDYSGDYVAMVGKSNNGGNGNCNGTLSDAICVQSTATKLPTLGQGDSLTFTFDFICNNCTELGSWDFLSSGNCVANPNANCYAISANGTPTPVPEPSVAMLYGATLAVGLVFAWRKRTRADRRETRSPIV